MIDFTRCTIDAIADAALEKQNAVLDKLKEPRGIDIGISIDPTNLAQSNATELFRITYKQLLVTAIAELEVELLNVPNQSRF